MIMCFALLLLVAGFNIAKGGGGSSIKNEEGTYNDVIID